MKKKLSIYVVLLLFIYCKHSTTKEPGFKIIAHVSDKLDSNKFKNNTGDEKGNYYSVSIDLFNKTDTTSSVMAMSCTWQENFIFSNRNISLLYDSICKNNFLHAIEIESKQTKKFQGVIWLSDSLIVSNDKNLKLGFIVIKRQEISSLKFEDVLRDKVEKGQNIVWSDPIELSEVCSK